MDVIGSDWIGVDVIGSDWIGMDVIGSGWIGVDMIGLEWYQLHCFSSVMVSLSSLGLGFISHSSVWQLLTHLAPFIVILIYAIIRHDLSVVSPSCELRLLTNAILM